MARIRRVDISHFRSIQSFAWAPAPGMNCLVGPGDSGKSSILDAIDFCLGARRNIQFTDADFFNLDVQTPISITVTVGELSDGLKNLDSYGLYLRSFHAATAEVQDEPGGSGETVLSLNLTVGSDLEPVWSLVSNRAAAQNQSRNLAWADRTRIAPTRLGAFADYNLGWRRGSVLNSLTDERIATSGSLVEAARDARNAFGDKAVGQLGQSLAIVSQVAAELGIQSVGNAKALLDAHSVSFSGGTVSLHSETGVPLRGLGLGSTRLLIAGLQYRAASNARIIIVDEVEHGLEPHRICRVLLSLGSKDPNNALQAFLTTHSPVAIRELSGSQITVVRNMGARHDARLVGTTDEIQGTIRVHPDALLARKIAVCEGASEVGLLRGIDQFNVANGYASLLSVGAALLDANGVTNIYQRLMPLASLGYAVAAFRDDDVQPDQTTELAYLQGGGKLVKWREGRTLEDELFLSLPDDAVVRLLTRAVDLHGEEMIDQHIRSTSVGALGLTNCLAGRTPAIRAILGKAARTKKAGWFKSVTWMEDVARDIVGPARTNSDPEFIRIVDDLFAWIFHVA